jgi:hypothetical protein
MASKPKTRKAPAVKARAPAAEVNKIDVLASRFRWLEADRDYQMALAPREPYDDRHDAEQEKIIAKLRTLVPKDYYELSALFRFAIDECLLGDLDIDMLSNIYDALPGVFGDERKTALQEGMENMREFLNKRTGEAFDVASDPEIIKRIGWGNA